MTDDLTTVPEAPDAEFDLTEEFEEEIDRP